MEGSNKSNHAAAHQVELRAVQPGKGQEGEADVRVEAPKVLWGQQAALRTALCTVLKQQAGGCVCCLRWSAFGRR